MNRLSSIDMRLFIFYIATLLIVFPTITKAIPSPPLTSSAEVSILTCSPGGDLYSLFGHSAIRVQDQELGIDDVFNYGTFSYDEDFYFNFTMGRLNYRLGVSRIVPFLRGYQAEGRGVSEQILDLDLNQKQAVLDFLVWNSQPENCYYLYDFFYDNCSSIIRDVLDTTMNGEVVFTDLTESDHSTFRNMIDRYLIYDPWGDFGIDLGLGLPCDKVATYQEYMFLPDKLSEAIDQAKLNGKSLVKSTRDILPAKGLSRDFSLFDPIPLFWMLFGFIAILSAIGFKRGSRLAVLDYVLLLVLGFVGALLFFLWFITDHTATANNFNLLWALPTHLLVLPFLWNVKIRKTYFMIVGGLIILTLVLFPFLPQMLHLATIPLMLAILVRSFVNIKLT